MSKFLIFSSIPPRYHYLLCVGVPYPIDYIPSPSGNKNSEYDCYRLLYPKDGYTFYKFDNNRNGWEFHVVDSVPIMSEEELDSLL